MKKDSDFKYTIEDFGGEGPPQGEEKAEEGEEGKPPGRTRKEAE